MMPYSPLHDQDRSPGYENNFEFNLEITNKRVMGYLFSIGPKIVVNLLCILFYLSREHRIDLLSKPIIRVIIFLVIVRFRVIYFAVNYRYEENAPMDFGMIVTVVRQLRIVRKTWKFLVHILVSIYSMQSLVTTVEFSGEFMARINLHLFIQVSNYVNKSVIKYKYFNH